MKLTSIALILATAQAQHSMLCMNQSRFKERLPQLKKLMHDHLQERINSYSINRKLGALDIVTSQGQQFILHRFFPMENGWHYSNEFSGDAEDMVDHLLNR